jgi:hypothetical protein
VEGVKAGAIADLSTASSDILVQLVHALDPTETSAAGMGQEDAVERANAVIGWASEHAIPSLTQTDDLRDANPRLILPFVMGLFTWYHTYKANKGTPQEVSLFPFVRGERSIASAGCCRNKQKDRKKDLPRFRRL